MRMKQFQNRLWICGLIGLASAAGLQAQPWSGILSPARAIDWSKAGVPGGIPSRTTICSTLNPGATPAQINSAIAACPANQVVFLSAGTYNLNNGIIFNNKRNVTLRGAGASQTKLVFTGANTCGGVGGNICFINGDDNWIGGPGNVANWTGGYAKGTTQITLSSTANLKIGTMVNLDQVEDSSDDGTIFQAANATSGNCQGCNNGGRDGRTQTQIVQVTAISGQTVTITPGLYLPNWRANRSPQAWWSSDTPISGSGVEDMSLDSRGVTNRGGIVTFYNALGCWVKGVRSLMARDSHVKFWQSAHNTVSNSYFYGNQVAQSQSYGTSTYLAGDNLIENNIFQHVTVPTMNETSQGDVYAYNFSTDNFYSDGSGRDNGTSLHSAYTHAAGNAYLMWEGNIFDGLALEDYHGPAHLITVFRNRFFGWETPKTNRTQPIINQGKQRFTNVIGNVLGTASYHTIYSYNYGENPTGNCEKAIYTLGWSGHCGNWSASDCTQWLGCPQPDLLVARTLFRWGNYDTVTKTSRFVASEVPTTAAGYPNTIPATQTLPPSFYRTSRPSWWGTPWGTPPWPAHGPDITGGDLPNLDGHANKIPSLLCYEHLTNDGSNGYKVFNAGTCYTTGSVPVTLLPPTGIQALVQ